jgi:predicted short-subunit dehydrogenase-like oxidoreductase (DUF2520 family)
VNTINVIGCGNVGKTLARLWTEHRVFQVRIILNRSLESGRRAVEFVGAGRAVRGYRELEPADAIMISASDEAIETCCRQLRDAEVLHEGVVVFHCSGSLPSTLLAAAKSQAALIASVHPVKSFADPASAARTFAGTFCAIEGDTGACDLLGDALSRIGATTFPVDPQFKTVYHAGTVFVSNYLVALVEVGLRCFQQAGIPRETATQILEPIVMGTASNTFALGPVRALTGPIARGESSVVERQHRALGEWNDLVEHLYTALGQVAIDLSAAQGHANPDALAAIKEILR